MTKPNEIYSPRYDLIALAIIAISFAVRYWFVASGQLNLVQDEAQYWDWIRRPQLSYYSKGPLVAWVIAAGCKLFGNTELGVRFAAIIGLSAIQVAVYIGVSRVWRQYKLAIYALFILATIPMLNALGILMTTDNPLILCWTISFFALSAATRKEPNHTVSNWPFIIIAITLALGILAKYMMLAFLGLGATYAIILHIRGQLPDRFWPRFILAAVVGTVIGMLPILLWNMQNDWVGFKHVAKLSTGESKPFELRIGPFFEMLGAQIGLFAPWWFVFVVTGGWRAIKKSVFGPVGGFDATYRNYVQTALFFWPLWLFITFKALFSKVEANWTAATFMAGAILAGMAVVRWWEKPQRRTRGKAILTCVAALLTLLMFASPLIPVPDEFNITNRLKGWESLGTKVGELTQTQFNDPSKVFVFSDHYDTTSELAFYTPGQPLTYCAWIFDRRMNQYDIWPGPNQGKLGWDAILVRERWYAEDSTPKAITDMFESVGPQIRFETTSNGQPIRKFTLQVCKGYTGYWPKHEGRF